MTSRSRASEDDLIARFFAPLAGEGGLDLKDDAACWRPEPGQDLVLTADAVVAGVHFLAEDPPGSIARKALAVNASDLAAKGAAPAGYLLTLGLPADWTESWLAAFAQGLAEAGRDFGCTLLGGDTVRASGGLTIAITAIGQVPHATMVRRTSARPGDLVCVSGTIGDAALGLRLQPPRPPDWSECLTAAERDFLVDRYRHPRPRLALAAALRDHARAAMDVSDGLVGDLTKMMRASGVSAAIELDRVPLSPAARHALAADPSLIDRLVTGGDDYEILCTIPEGQLEAFLARTEQAGVPASVLGRVTAGDGPVRFRLDGTERSFEHGSFSHF